jgi:predicted ferric reductase
VWLTSPTGIFMRQLDAVNARPGPVFIAGGIGIVLFIGRIMNRSEPDAQLIYAKPNT